MATSRPSFLQLPAHELRAWRWRHDDADPIRSASGLPLVERGGAWYLDRTVSATGAPVPLPDHGWLVESDGIVLVFDDDAFTRWHRGQQHPSVAAAPATETLDVHAIDAVALAEGYD